uniref:Uncharacterized protein n=1 Tax=Oryza barthii TaxID=65489 RepID=A0A0D3GZM3_9ORYZ
MGSGERDLGARVLPLSLGRHFIRQGDDRSRPLDRTAQICLASGHRCRRLRCAQWAAEVHRTAPHMCHGQLLGLRAVELTRLPEDGPSHVWAGLGRPGPKVNLIKQYGSDFLN